MICSLFLVLFSVNKIFTDRKNGILSAAFAYIVKMMNAGDLYERLY